MKALEVTGSGIVKFSIVKPLNSGKYVRENLLQHITDRGKKSMFKMIEFIDDVSDPWQKDIELEFKGVLRENIYKKDGQFISTGLEIIASEIEIKDIF